MKRRGRIKAVSLLLALLMLALTMSGCASGSENGEENNQVVETPTETPPAEPVDIDNIPASLEPMEGWYPVVVKFYTDGELMSRGDMVPCISPENGTYYTLQEAESYGLVSDFRAYSKTGYEVDTAAVMTLQDAESGLTSITPCCAFSFYVQNGTDAQLLPLPSHALTSFEDLYAYYQHNWSINMYEYAQKGGAYDTYYLDSLPSGGEGTAECITFTLGYYEGRARYGSRDGNTDYIVYYPFLEDVAIESLPLGGES